MAIEERELDDADLVSAAQEGDTEAFSELFRRHYPAVRRICARRLGNLADADEVAQAAFVRAYERIEQCGGERRFGAWVQVIAYRLGADARRLQARATPTDDPAIGDAALGPNSCEDALLRAERVAEVRQMLGTLPPRQREVIIARDLEGRRPGEIAASLGLSLGAVDSLLLRARRRMASAWQAATVEHGAASLQVTTASLVATTAVRPGVVSGAVAALGRAVNRVSLHIANAFGLVPGGPPTSQSMGRLAVTGAALAVPVVGLIASPPSSVSAGRVVVAARPTVPGMGLPGVKIPAVRSTPAPPPTPTTPVAVDVPESTPSLPSAPPLSLSNVSTSTTPAPPGLPAVVGQAVSGAVSAVTGTVSAVTGAVTNVASAVNNVAAPTGQGGSGVGATLSAPAPTGSAPTGSAPTGSAPTGLVTAPVVPTTGSPSSVAAPL